MRLLRSFPIMAFTLVLLSIIGFCAALQSVELMLAAGALAALSWYVTEGPRGRTLPRWVSNVLVVAAALNVIVGLARSSETLAVVGQFCVWLTLIKLYERRTARDHGHLMALSLLLMLIGCLRSTNLSFGVLLLAYVGLGLYVLLLYQLYATQEAISAARRGVRPQPDPPPARVRPTVGRHNVAHFRALTVGVGVSGLLLSALLFVIFPRTVGRGMLGAPGDSTRQAGYVDEVDLNSGTRISDSRRPVFEVALRDRQGRPIRPAQPPLLRGAVLDTYFDGRWTASTAPWQHFQTEREELTMLGAVTDVPPGALWLHYRFFDGTRTLFAPYLPVAVATDHRCRLSLDPVAQTVGIRPGQGALQAFTIVSVPAAGDELVAAVAEAAVLPTSPRGYFHDHHHPSVLRIRELARSVLEQAALWPGPTETTARRVWGVRAAEALAAFLRDDPFRYTLDMSDVVLRAEDPIEHFLLTGRRGHCEYFASALAAMCQTVDIEARVVTGFAATEYDPEQEAYVVLARNAHAWVEVRAGAHAFRTVDPTPAQVLETRAASTPTLAQRAHWLYQRLEGTWRRRVIEFDGRSQSRLIDALDARWSERLATVSETVRDWLQRVNRSFLFWPMGYVWLGLVALAAVLAVASAARILARLRALQRTLHVRRWRDATTRRLMRQLGFYLDMLTVLKKGGRAKPRCRTPLVHAQRLGNAAPAVGDRVRQATELYYQARYGGRPLSKRELDQARRLVRELATVLEVHA